MKMLNQPLLAAYAVAAIFLGPITPAVAVVMVDGCANSGFCTMDELTPGGGGSITVDGVRFSDFINIELSRVIDGNLQQGNTSNVQVFGDDADLLRPTITFALNGELAVPGLDQFDDGLLAVDFLAGTTDSIARLTGFGLELGVRAFTLTDQGAVQVRGDAENPPGTNIPPTGTLEVEEDRRSGGLTTTINALFDLSQSSLEGGFDARTFSDVADNAVSLETFSYFVTQSSGPQVPPSVPEPATTLLLGAGLGGVALVRRRRVGRR